jgi:SAM-dependent methyltransferase
VYTSALGSPTRVDIMHLDDSNPRATIVADLTKPNDIESDRFDCIICTQVLCVIYELDVAVAESHRILKPGGVLLLSVPTFLRIYQPDLVHWRFTPLGLRTLLGRHFGEPNVEVQGVGNSLTAAGIMRGLVFDEFTPAEREPYDARFTIELCARAVKVLEG